MSDGRREDDGDRADFAEAMKGVRRLADRDKLQPPPEAPAAARPPAAEPEAPVEFQLLPRGEELAGLAPGIDRKHLRRLRSGSVRVDARIDLHGLRGAAARDAVRAALSDAVKAGHRCVLVIHGRGHHSPQDPVLKRSLPEWLAEPPHGGRIMAFHSATASDGGAGATYVLLRRRREPSGNAG